METRALTIYTDNGFNEIPDDAVVVSECSINYSQKPDCCGPQEHNHLNIHTEDGGGGMYMVLETTRWAISSIDEMIAVLTDFKNRSGMK